MANRVSTVGLVVLKTVAQTGSNSAAITTTLTGISQTFNGTVTHNKTAAITTSLSGVNQTLNATLTRNRIASITTTLSGISQTFNAVRANRFADVTTSLGGLAQSFGVIKGTATGATDIDNLGPLDWRIAIVDKNGRPTPEFQRRWNTQRNVNTQLADLGSDANPVMDGSATPGVSSRYSRGDHKHPSDTSRLSTADAAATYLTIANAASTYLTITNAASTYLSISSAATTYAPLRTTVTTVSGLPSASTAGNGATYIVTDASSPTLGATVTGGGSTRVRVNSDGTNWKVG